MRHPIIAAILCAAVAVVPIAAEEQVPLRSAGLPGFEWLLPSELHELEDSDSITWIHLADDRLGVLTELPADRDQIVVVVGGHRLFTLAETTARHLAQLGWRRVYVLFDFGC